MNTFKNHQRPRRKYRFDIVGHKKALKIWWDSPFKQIENYFNYFLLWGVKVTEVTCNYLFDMRARGATFNNVLFVAIHIQ